MSIETVTIASDRHGLSRSLPDLMSRRQRNPVRLRVTPAQAQTLNMLGLDRLFDIEKHPSTEPSR